MFVPWGQKYFSLLVIPLLCHLSKHTSRNVQTVPRGFHQEISSRVPSGQYELPPYGALRHSGVRFGSK